MAFDPGSSGSDGDKFGMVALNGTTEVELALDERYIYELIHTGKDGSGNGDANAALSAWLSTLSGEITADGTVEDEKYELTSGGAQYLGPGISKLYLVSTANADAVLKIVRIGSPTTSY